MRYSGKRPNVGTTRPIETDFVFQSGVTVLSDPNVSVCMSETRQVGRTWRWLEEHVANPVLRWLLRSPLHGLASDSLLLLSYRGKQSGKRFTTPVMYERDEGTFVVTTFRDPVVWWRNFRDGHPATLWVRGEPVETAGQAVTDPGEIADWIEELDDRGRTRLLGFFDLDPDQPRDELEAEANGLVVVRFEPTG